MAAVAATVLTGEGHAGEAYAVTVPRRSPTVIPRPLSEELGREIEHVQVGMDDARAGMLDAGVLGGLVDDYVSLLEWYETGGSVKLYPTVEDITGKPARSIETFVSDYTSAFEA